MFFKPSMAKILTILHEPNPFLRRTMKPVPDPAAKEIKQLVEDMIVTMRKAKGIGLAATQVGYDGRVIIIETKNGPLACINPEIVKTSQDTEQGEEGCLSVPGTYGFVKRFKRVSVRSFDVSGKPQTHDASGLLARVFQHEIDHLNGVVFIDKVEDFSGETATENAVAI